MTQARTIGSDGGVRLDRVAWTVLVAAAAAIGVAAYAALRGEPEAWGRWPQPAPALGTDLIELHPDAWDDRDVSFGDDLETTAMHAEVALLSPDPYHASLGSPTPTVNLVA